MAEEVPAALLAQFVQAVEAARTQQTPPSPRSLANAKAVLDSRDEHQKKTALLKVDKKFQMPLRSLAAMVRDEETEPATAIAHALWKLAMRAKSTSQSAVADLAQVVAWFPQQTKRFNCRSVLLANPAILAQALPERKQQRSRVGLYYQAFAKPSNLGVHDTDRHLLLEGVVNPVLDTSGRPAEKIYVGGPPPFSSTFRKDWKRRSEFILFPGPFAPTPQESSSIVPWNLPWDVRFESLQELLEWEGIEIRPSRALHGLGVFVDGEWIPPNKRIKKEDKKPVFRKGHRITIYEGNRTDKKSLADTYNFSEISYRIKPAAAAEWSQPVKDRNLQAWFTIVAEKHDVRFHPTDGATGLWRTGGNASGVQAAPEQPHGLKKVTKMVKGNASYTTTYVDPDPNSDVVVMLDGALKRSAGAYINAVPSENAPPYAARVRDKQHASYNMTANVASVWNNKKNVLEVWAITSIYKGQELIMDYGAEYWESDHTVSCTSLCKMDLV